MNRDVIGISGSGDIRGSSGEMCIGISELGDVRGSSGEMCIGLSGSGSGSLKCSMDENPWW